MCRSEGTHQIVMSFLPPVLGCLLNQKKLPKGGSQARKDPFLATPLTNGDREERKNVTRQGHDNKPVKSAGSCVDLDQENSFETD